MINKIISWLEEQGYSHIEKAEETGSHIEFKGTDERGMFLEFKYEKKDGYMMDRNVGAKYYDITGRIPL
jgi:hypothetical protein